MYTKHNRSGWHRMKRESVPGVVEDSTAGHALEERQPDDGDQQLPGPVTLTLTIIHDPASTPIFPDIPDPPHPPSAPVTNVNPVPSSPSIASVSLEETSTIEQPSTIALPTPTLLSPSSSSSTLPAPPTTPSLSVISPPIASSVPRIPDNDSNNTTKNSPKLSNGAIAGIVIGCLVVLIIAIFFGLRKRSAKKQSRSRGFWARSKGLGFGKDMEPTPYTYNPDSTINGQSLGANMGFSGQPATVTGTGNSRSPNSPRSLSTVGLGLPQGLPSVYGSDSATNSTGPISPSQLPVLYTTVVSRSFVPRLPDELSISTGETLRVLQEYDDGWAECMKLGGETGMVPMESFDKRDERRKSNRYSSLPGARRGI